MTPLDPSAPATQQDLLDQRSLAAVNGAIQRALLERSIEREAQQTGRSQEEIYQELRERAKHHLHQYFAEIRKTDPNLAGLLDFRDPFDGDQWF